MSLFDFITGRSKSRWATKHDLLELQKRVMKAEEAIAQLNEAKAKQAEANAEIRARIQEQSDRIKALEDAAANADIPEPLATAIAEVVAGDKELADIIPNPPAPNP